MPRKATGQLILRTGMYRARFGNGPLIPLHTASRELAEVRLAELVTSRERPEPGVERFGEACQRIVAALARDGMRTADERLSRLRRYAWPLLGTLPVTTIRPQQISEVLSAAARAGLAQETVLHLRVDMSKVFRELVRDGVLEHNPATADRVRTPKIARDKRKRVLLTDEEFATFVASSAVSRELRTMAVISRCFGGLRPSDLYAWQWSDIDLETWQWADAPRPKTEHHNDSEAARERITLPDLVAGWLREWWRSGGAPNAGAVFPRRVENLARELRRALKIAGVTRLGLHESNDRTLRTDFYSFRRAFVTAVAASGLNAQTSMRIVGHRSMTTHQRYHIPTTLEIPATAMPMASEDESAQDCAFSFEWVELTTE